MKPSEASCVCRVCLDVLPSTDNSYDKYLMWLVIEMFAKKEAQIELKKSRG